MYCAIWRTHNDFNRARPHKQISDREQTSTASISTIFGAISAIRAKTVLILMCEDGAGQFHHGKATNRLGSTVISLSGISLAGMLTFLWVMHQNNGYNNNIFLCHGGKKCVRKQPSYMRNTSYFPGLLTNLRRTPYFCYSKVHVVGFRQHFELERPIELRN